MKIKVQAENGLHARPASQIVMKANQYQSDITMITEEKVINAKSIMSIMSSGLAYGDELVLSAVGSDASIAELEMARFIESIVG